MARRTQLLLTLVLGTALLGASTADAAVRCMGKRATIVRDGGSDVIRGTAGADVIHAGRGRDRIYGRGGRDTICGGRGSDFLYGGAGSDRLFGESGNDRLEGGPGADLVDGGRGDDPRVAGGRGSFDNVVGGTGNDRVDGGPGRHDIASYVTTSARLRIDLRSRTARGAEHERLRRFEDALSGSGDDVLVGGGGPNRLDGGPGDDSLHAAGPSDAAFGGPGSDACVGGFAAVNSCGPGAGGGSVVVVELIRSIDASASLVIGGSGGPDRVSLRRSGNRFLAGVGGAPVTPGSTQACAYAGSQVIACPAGAGRVQVAMGAGDDVISVAGLPRGVDATVDGGPGSDSLTGGPGQDTLYGGDDRVRDRLAGGGGDDQLFGINTSHPRKDSGGGTMIGGRGDDLLVGGQPCNGDRFLGGPGRNDSASFARVRNGGTNVRAKIGGAVSDPDVAGCKRGRISRSIEKIEGSPGRDLLFGDGSGNVLLGRGGSDFLDGRGGRDRCVGGAKRDRMRACEQRFR